MQKITIPLVSSRRLLDEIEPFEPDESRHPALGQIQPNHSPFKGKLPVYPNREGGYSVFTPQQGEIRLRTEFHPQVKEVKVPTATRLLLEAKIGRANLERMLQK